MGFGLLELRIEQVDQAAIPAQVELSRTTYNEAWANDAEHFGWKHSANPAGASVSANLYDGSTLVGRSMMQPRAFRADGRLLRAAVVVDLLIAPPYRSALTLLQLLRGQTVAGDFDLLLHTSNLTSDAIYRRLLRYPVAFTLKAFGLPLRSRNILKKILGASLPGIDLLTAPWRLLLRAAASLWVAKAGMKIGNGLPSEREFDSVMVEFQRHAGPHFERTRAFLEWRFRKGPLFQGELATLRIQGVVRGYLAWRKVEIESLTFFVLMDIVVSGSLSATEQIALRLELARRGIEAGADLLFVMVNQHNPLLSQLVGLPLIPIPDSYLPHPSPIFVHVRRPDLGHLREEPSTYLTLADIDYF